MGKVRNILEGKSRVIISVNTDTTVFKALELMLEKNIGALLVMEHERLRGIFTERDYARKVVLRGKSSKLMKIKEIMVDDVVVVTSDTTIEDCMWLMTNRFIRHLPVVDEDRITGIISIGDVVKYIINEQKFIIGNLEHYITGTV
uniref:CBS domain-containing protein n=1 Tax=Pedobacter schmidteae TaxID=2201271 RepID=UPI000EAD8E2B|nr:CBS domain-containing protein [Pedobacter schmidteae]